MMRFLAMGPEPAVVEHGDAVRTALLCTVPNMTGAILGMVQPLATLNLNVSHFTSRPTREPWSYQFYLEFEHRAHEESAARALEAIKRACTYCRVLGTFPRWALPRPGSNGGASRGGR